MEENFNLYTTEYAWYFPSAPRLIANGRLTWTYQVTLTVPHLADEERDQVLARFHRRLDRLSQMLQELQDFAVTDRLLWRCLALTYVQIQSEFFALEHAGFLLLAHGVALEKAIVRLHELLQVFQVMPTLPGMDVYYTLPTRQARPEDGSLDLALSVTGRARCVADGWIYQVDWNPLTSTGTLSIGPGEQLAVELGTTMEPVTVKPLGSKDERDRTLTDTNGDCQPLSLESGWIPCW